MNQETEDKIREVVVEAFAEKLNDLKGRYFEKGSRRFNFNHESAPSYMAVYLKGVAERDELFKGFTQSDNLRFYTYKDYLIVEEIRDKQEFTRQEALFRLLAKRLRDNHDLQKVLRLVAPTKSEAYMIKLLETAFLEG